MKKILGVGVGISAAAAVALMGAGTANAAPDVSGETYVSAQQILHSQGYSTMFGGSVGSDVQQGKCIVVDQTSLTRAKVRLRLNCTKAVVEAASARTAPAPAPGAPPGAPPGGPVAVVPGAAPVPGGFPQVGVPVPVG